MTAAANPAPPMPWVYDDGGRAAAGYRGHTRDCVARAIAIATGAPYQHVYDALADAHAQPSRRHPDGRPRTARAGIDKRHTRAYMAAQGWHWTHTMGIGTGTLVHLRADELPVGTVMCKSLRPFKNEKANRLGWLFRRDLERAMRIELTASAWEAEVLPLYDAREGAHFMRLSAALQ